MAVSTYFVTGAGGVVGSAFVGRLLQEPDARAVVLLRPKAGLSVERRLESLCAFWGADESARARVRCLEGDTEQPQLGLKPTEWAALAGSVTHIVHSAAIVKMNLPLDEARRA